MAGYVLKRAPDNSLVRAIRAVYAGDTYLDPWVSNVLVFLAQGKTYQEVVETLFISVKTVDFHRANLMRKLGLSNRAELVRFAIERELVT